MSSLMVLAPSAAVLVAILLIRRKAEHDGASRAFKEKSYQSVVLLDVALEIVLPEMCLVPRSFRNAGTEHFGNSTLTSLPHPPRSACRAWRPGLRRGWCWR